MVNTEKTEIKSRVFFLTDILIVLSIFCLANYIKFRIFIPQGSYLGLFIMFLLYWFFFSLYYKKYKEIIHRPFWFAWRLIFWSTVLSFFFITLTVSIANLWSVSRLFIIIVTLGITAFETVFLLSYRQSG